MVLERTSGMEWTSWSLNSCFILVSFFSPSLGICFICFIWRLRGGLVISFSHRSLPFSFIFSHDTTSPGFSCSYLQFEYTMGDAKEYIIFSESCFGIACNREVNAECICWSKSSKNEIYLKVKNFAKAYENSITAQSYKDGACVRDL